MSITETYSRPMINFFVFSKLISIRNWLFGGVDHAGAWTDCIVTAAANEPSAVYYWLKAFSFRVDARLVSIQTS